MTPKDKTIGVPMALPIIGGGQKVSVDEIIRKLMENIHKLNTEYQSFVGVINELSTRVALLESRTSAVENKQVAFPPKIEVVVKQDMAHEHYKEWQSKQGEEKSGTGCIPPYTILEKEK